MNKLIKVNDLIVGLGWLQENSIDVSNAVEIPMLKFGNPAPDTIVIRGVG